jgi:hypothetical protein
MNPYAMLGSRAGTSEAATLSLRLAAWHDAMVAHERRLRTAPTRNLCHEECPHVEARALWTEALATFGEHADDLVFLRSHAKSAGGPAVDSRRLADAHPGQPGAVRPSTRAGRPTGGARGRTSSSASHPPGATAAEV